MSSIISKMEFITFAFGAISSKVALFSSLRSNCITSCMLVASSCVWAFRVIVKRYAFISILNFSVKHFFSELAGFVVAPGLANGEERFRKVFIQRIPVLV